MLIKFNKILALLVFSITLTSCANREIVEPIEHNNPLLTYRWISIILTIFLTFIRIGILEKNKPNSGNSWAITNILGTVIGLPFNWTIIGEWGYLISKWMFNIWQPVIPLSFFLTGLQGNILSVLGTTTLLGFVFPDAKLFYWSVIPAFIGLIVNTISLYIRKSTNK